VLLVVDEGKGAYSFLTNGKAGDIFDETGCTALWTAYSTPEDYYGSIQAYLSAARGFIESAVGASDPTETSSEAESETETGAGLSLKPYFFDGMGILTDDELDELNAYAANLSAGYGIGIGMLVPDDLGGKTPEQYGQDYLGENGLLPDSLLIVEDGGSGGSSLFAYGKAKTLLAADDLSALLAAFQGADSCYDGCNAYIDKAIEVLPKAIAAGAGTDGAASETDASAAETQAGTKAAEAEPLLMDQLNLLTADEQKALLAKLTDISKRQECSVVIVTTKDLGGEDIKNCAADLYDYGGYGVGPDRAGVLLLVYINGDDRERRMVTTGFGIKAFTDAGIEYILDETRGAMSKGKYAAALNDYADQCDKFLTQARAGKKPYDTGNLPKKKFAVAGNLALCLLVGALAALILVLIERRKCRNVAAKAGAADYQRPDSLVVTGGGDLFLYRKVARTERPKSGGSSTSGSSSGTTHGGGGDSF
jgi:uncharacterized protein